MKRTGIMHPAVLGIVLAMAVACGGSVAAKAETTLDTALTATNAAKETFVSFDKAHQEAIVGDALTQEEAERELAEYRSGPQKQALQAFTVAYSSIGAAAAILPLVETGEKDTSDLTKLLIQAVDASQAAVRAVNEIRGAFDEGGGAGVESSYAAPTGREVPSPGVQKAGARNPAALPGALSGPALWRGIRSGGDPRRGLRLRAGAPPGHPQPDLRCALARSGGAPGGLPALPGARPGLRL